MEVWPSYWEYEGGNILILCLLNKDQKRGVCYISNVDILGLHIKNCFVNHMINVKFKIDLLYQL